MRRRTLFLLALLLPAGSLNAQQMLPRYGAIGLAFEAIRPLPKHDAVSVLSAGYFLSAHFQTSEQTLVIMELPFAHLAEASGFTFDNSSQNLGNPYAGVQVRSRIVTFDLGVRLPLQRGHAHASSWAIYSDIQRMEAFTPKLMTVHGGIAVQTVPVNGLTVGASVAPAFMMITEDKWDNELYTDYSANVGYRGTQVRGAVRIDGLALLTEHGSFGERSIHQVIFTGDAGAGRFRPGLYIALPLDSGVSDFLDATLGVTFQLALR